MISILHQLSRQGRALSGRASRYEAPISSFQTISSMQPVSSPSSPHQDKVATPISQPAPKPQPSLLSQIGRGLGTPADMEDSGTGPAPGASLRGPQNAYEAHVGRDLLGVMTGLGTRGIIGGLLSGGVAKLAGAPSSLAVDFGIDSAVPQPLSAIRAIADAMRLGYAVSVPEMLSKALTSRQRISLPSTRAR